jgi:drug/metabolite transporter (DMT)-like permease
MAYLFANEVLGVSGILGGGLIVAGMLISELSDVLPLKRKSPPAP